MWGQEGHPILFWQKGWDCGNSIYALPLLCKGLGGSDPGRLSPSSSGRSWPWPICPSFPWNGKVLLWSWPDVTALSSGRTGRRWQSSYLTSLFWKREAEVVMIISHFILRVKGSGGGHDHICNSSPQKRQGRLLLMTLTFFSCCRAYLSLRCR